MLGRKLTVLIYLPTRRNKLFSLLFHSHSERRLFIDLFLRSVLSHILRDLHGAEVWAAHGTKMRELGAFLWQRLIVILACNFRIEREVELIFPAKLEARLG